MEEIHLLQLEGYPIWDQLALEEALVRADTRNWCLINHGSPTAIVMGISGKPERLLNQELLSNKPVPLIKRFSGGGTVVVDHHTLFITLICRHHAVPVEPYPQPIMRWTEKLYAPLLPHPLFSLREHDYVLGDHKFGGNAQYLKKDRWLHHSSLLWDYDADNMQYLLLPERRPTYRKERNHNDFLCRLKDHLPCPHAFLTGIVQQLRHQFHVLNTPLEQAKEVLSIHHRTATTLLHH